MEIEIPSYEKDINGKIPEFEPPQRSDTPLGLAKLGTVRRVLGPEADNFLRNFYERSGIEPGNWPN